MPIRFNMGNGGTLDLRYFSKVVDKSSSNMLSCRFLTAFLQGELGGSVQAQKTHSKAPNKGQIMVGYALITMGWLGRPRFFGVQ